MLDLKMPFQSLYTWIIVWNILHISNFSDILEFCYFCILKELSCILLVYYGCLCTSNKFELLIYIYIYIFDI
jgi:hypothetical protein